MSSMRLARLSVLSDNRTFPSNKPLFHIIQLNDYNWANEDFVELGRRGERRRQREIEREGGISSHVPFGGWH